MTRLKSEKKVWQLAALKEGRAVDQICLMNGFGEFCLVTKGFKAQNGFVDICFKPYSIARLFFYGLRLN